MEKGNGKGVTSVRAPLTRPIVLNGLFKNARVCQREKCRFHGVSHWSIKPIYSQRMRKGRGSFLGTSGLKHMSPLSHDPQCLFCFCAFSCSLPGLRFRTQTRHQLGWSQKPVEIRSKYISGFVNFELGRTNDIVWICYFIVIIYLIGHRAFEEKETPGQSR